MVVRLQCDGDGGDVVGGDWWWCLMTCLLRDDCSSYGDKMALVQ